jgi:cell shape-determining protein MreC
VVLIFVLGAVFFSLSDGGILRVLTPIWYGENFVARGVQNLFLFFHTKDSLIKENQSLKDKIASDQILLSSTQTLSDSQDNLLRTLGRNTSQKGITAAVLVHPPETPYDVLVIDVGASDGVSVGQAVALSADSSTMVYGPKIGVISEVFNKNSKVKLFSASGEKTSAVLERYSVPVVLLGRGGGNFELTLQREVEVEVGDKILSADISRVLVGVVKDVEVSATDSFKKVLVVSVANIYTTEFVTVIQ